MTSAAMRDTLPTTGRLTAEREGRLVLVRVSLSLLQQMMTTGAETTPEAGGLQPQQQEAPAHCIEGLPAGAILVRAAVNVPLGEVQMIFAHSSFRQVPAGVHFPHLLPTFHQRLQVTPSPTPLDTAPDDALAEATTAGVVSETEAVASADARRARAYKRRVETGGYVPVTPLGPPPQGTPPTPNAGVPVEPEIAATAVATADAPRRSVTRG